MTDTDTGTEEPQDAAETAESTRQIGRGALYLSCTKLYFILFSYLIYWGITAAFRGGDAATQRAGDALLGDYKAVGNWLSVISVVLVMGTTQAISRFVGKAPAMARIIKRRGLVLQFILGLVISGAYCTAAPYIAKDPRLVEAMRISAGIPLVYAVYAVMMGTLNGQKRFGEQALADAGFTTLKTGLVVGFVFAFQTVESAYTGFLGAAVGVFLLASFLTNRRHGTLATSDPAAPTTKEILAFQVQTVAWMLLIQWIVQFDNWYVQWFSDFTQATAGAAADTLASFRELAPNFSGTALQTISEALRDARIALTEFDLPAIEAALGNVSDLSNADRAGFLQALGSATPERALAALSDLTRPLPSEIARNIYGTSQVFAQISYSLVIAVTFVLFPLIANPELRGDPEKARSYIREALRYALLIVMGAAAIITARPERSLALLLQSLGDYQTSDYETLRALGIGYVFFALFFILCSTLNAFGRPRASIAITALVLLIQLAAGLALVPRFGVLGQAIASTVAMATGLFAALWVMGRQVGQVLPLPTLVRTLIAAGVLYGLAMAWSPEGKLITLVRYVASGVVYLVLLVLLREFTKADLQKFAQVIPGGKK